MTIAELNTKYQSLSPLERIQELYLDFSKILVTSSFGATAIYLLHLINRIKPDQTIYFLDTTYHFPETLAYKKQVTDLLHLTVTDLQGDAFRNAFTLQDQTWSKDPDLCCSVNKVEPLEQLKSGFEIWVSGLMHSQTTHREQLTVFEEKGGLLKFYPILDQTEANALAYIKSYALPRHPLLDKGFHSIGCTHCTVEGKAREGRWINKSKSECGLHH
ncbi:MAG TPA: phosphoadenylyl-sulfate reductase [Bacteroidia bacterium]|jgi:phosphoadenosine phosphosulfate reductase|nr:phosphoadenylyl-sulfate reductase [Bacteroidia bacterium]